MMEGLLFMDEGGMAGVAQDVADARANDIATLMWATRDGIGSDRKRSVTQLRRRRSRRSSGNFFLMSQHAAGSLSGVRDVVRDAVASVSDNARQSVTERVASWKLLPATFRTLRRRLERVAVKGPDAKRKADTLLAQLGTAEAQYRTTDRIVDTAVDAAQGRIPSTAQETTARATQAAVVMAAGFRLTETLTRRTNELEARFLTPEERAVPLVGERTSSGLTPLLIGAAVVAVFALRRR